MTAEIHSDYRSTRPESRLLNPGDQAWGLTIDGKFIEVTALAAGEGVLFRQLYQKSNTQMYSPDDVILTIEPEKSIEIKDGDYFVRTIKVT